MERSIVTMGPKLWFLFLSWQTNKLKVKGVNKIKRKQSVSGSRKKKWSAFCASLKASLQWPSRLINVVCIQGLAWLLVQLSYNSIKLLKKIFPLELFQFYAKTQQRLRPLLLLGFFGLLIKEEDRMFCVFFIGASRFG